MIGKITSLFKSINASAKLQLFKLHCNHLSFCYIMPNNFRVQINKCPCECLTGKMATYPVPLFLSIIQGHSLVQIDRWPCQNPMVHMVVPSTQCFLLIAKLLPGSPRNATVKILMLDWYATQGSCSFYISIGNFLLKIYKFANQNAIVTTAL